MVEQPGVVHVEQGRLQGHERNGVWSFAGVPYAAPPTGVRRWRPPARPESWEGVRPASTFGPVAPQAGGIFQSLGGAPEPMDEDCLFANIWTRRLDDAHRPVMVWFHGGSFVTGSGSQGLYRGGILAREGDVVVVTVNYRLGLLGFLCHPALAEPGETWLDGEPWRGTGNYGLADQIAALRWVRDNISAFGGDPGNVTIFGESAGGMSVAALLAIPEARPLFRRAIVQSGPPMTRTVSAASQQAESLVAELGVPLSREGLASVTSDRLVAWVTETSARQPAGLVVQPAVDDGLLAAPPGELVAAGCAKDKPLMIGTNKDEWAFFAAGAPRLALLGEPGLLRWLRRVTDDEHRARRLVEMVRTARLRRGEDGTPPALLSAIATESVFRYPSWQLWGDHAARAEPGVGTYPYLFTWESPMMGGALGSCHALEIPFVFGTVAHPAVQMFSGGGDAAMELSALMRRSWTTFAQSGVPSGMEQWEPRTRSTTVFGPWPERSGLLHLIDDPRGAELEALIAVRA